MHFTYYLQSQKDKGLYIGKTNDVSRRLKEHNSGSVSSTKSRRPFKLLGYESFKTEKEALAHEVKMKKGYNREKLKRLFKI